MLDLQCRTAACPSLLELTNRPLVTREAPQMLFSANQKGIRRLPVISRLLAVSCSDLESACLFPVCFPRSDRRLGSDLSPFPSFMKH